LFNEEERPPRKSKTWNHDEIMNFSAHLFFLTFYFHEDLRKVDKNKDQTKNYYFNFAIMLCYIIELYVLFELFITINACEWRRRTNTNQYIPDRMKELIFHGSDVICNGPIKVKTPPCPSLLKFFYSEFMVEYTNHVNYISFNDSNSCILSFQRHVSCEQNPLIRIRLNTNDRIARIFQLLRHKWSSALDRVARFLHFFRFFFHFKGIFNPQFSRLTIFSLCY
uniref:Ion_trans domain-containing protein n=1 Tax=Angiostrongylus cantonensis TaxID=6313 RepID=A0A0K0DLB3_ANGCA